MWDAEWEAVAGGGSDMEVRSGEEGGQVRLGRRVRPVGEREYE